MHVNPQNYTESHTKKVERIQTRGGFVEQHWGDELTEISADGSTGAFMNIYTGLSSVLRHRTIAWDRYRDLHDLFRNNGSVFDPFGNIVLQGHIMLMYDRGTYIGFFRTFEFEETDDQPFSFKLSWNFKVEEELMKIPGLVQDPNQRGKANFGNVPSFQSQNQVAGDPSATPSTTLAAVQQSTFDQRSNAIYSTALGSQNASQDAVNTATEGIQQAQQQFAQGQTDQAFQTLTNTHQTVSNIVKGG